MIKDVLLSLLELLTGRATNQLHYERLYSMRQRKQQALAEIEKSKAKSTARRMTVNNRWSRACLDNEEKVAAKAQGREPLFLRAEKLCGDLMASGRTTLTNYAGFAEQLAVGKAKAILG